MVADMNRDIVRFLARRIEGSSCHYIQWQQAYQMFAYSLVVGNATRRYLKS